MDPLYEKRREVRQSKEIKEQKPAKEETSSEKVFNKMMESFKDNEDLGEDSGLLNEIADKLAKYRLPIPMDSPFADTDMLVFKEDYWGDFFIKNSLGQTPAELLINHVSKLVKKLRYLSSWEYDGIAHVLESIYITLKAINIDMNQYKNYLYASFLQLNLEGLDEKQLKELLEMD